MKKYFFIYFKGKLKKYQLDTVYFIDTYKYHFETSKSKKIIDNLPH